MRRATLLLLVLVIVGLFAWLAPRRAVEVAIGARAETAPEEPGYIALDAQLTETGDDGAPIYRLDARRIEQSRPSAPIQLTEPQLAYQADAETSWRLQATHGELATERQQVEFAGAVQATGQRAGAASIVIHTTQLAIDMKQQHADSQDHVSIDWGRVRLSARGMHINLRDGSLKLDSQGHGEILY